MRYLIFILLLSSFLGYSQGGNPLLGGPVFDNKTSTERDEYSSTVGRTRLIFNETTGQFEYKNGNGSWTGFGGSTSFADLTGVPTDNTALSNALDLKADDDEVVKLTGNQNINGQKYFLNSIRVGQLGSINTYPLQIALSTSSTIGATPTGGYGGFYFNNDGTFRIQTSTLSTGDGANLGLEFDQLTTTKDLIFTDSDITWGGQSLISGGSGIDDQTASEVPIVDSGGYFTGTDVESALQELGNGTAGGSFGIAAEGTFTTDGSTTYTINHGLSYTPQNTRIQTQRLDDGVNSVESDPSIDNITATTFDVVFEGTPSGDPIAWRIYGSGSIVGQTANEVTITDTGDYFAATDVEGALAELAATGATTNATSFKDITTNTYTLTTGDRSTNTQSLRLQFRNDNDIKVSEPVTKGDGNVYRLVQDGSGNVKTDFYVHRGTNDSIYARTTAIGDNLLIEWDNDNEMWFVTGKYTSWSGMPDAAQDASLIADFNVDDLSETDGQSPSTFVDATGTYTADIVNFPTIEERGDGRKELEFDGLDDAFKLASNYAALDFDPDDDDFTIVLVLGNDAIGNDRILNKGSLAGLSGTQLGFNTNAGGTDGNFIAGATQQSYSGVQTGLSDNVIVIRGTSGTIEIFNNNTSLGSFSAGSYMTSHTWSLASRASGTDQFNEMSFRRLLFYSSALNNTKLTEIYTQEN